MEWNTKWDWENLDIFNSKGITSSKKLQSAYWGIGEGEDIDGSFNVSGVIGGSVGSASDMGNNSSAKSSISASTEFSFKEGINGNSQVEASVCSSEPFIGLKLGKRTYFENSYAKNNNKSSSSVLGVPVSSVVSTGKKVKSSSQNTPISRCQVEGCNLDLSYAKEYHRKHKVCESHSKSPKVIVAGLERRFCQQCSRFHSMSEFDEEKRSCRRRLSDHNARRRKPQQESIRFPYSSFYGTESVDMMSHSVGVQLSEVLNMPTLVRKITRTENFDQGLKESLCSNEDTVGFRSAPSLLSNNSWGSCETNSIPIDHHHHHIHASSSTITMHHPHHHQNGMHVAVPPSQGLPLSSQDYYCQPNQHLIDPRIHALAAAAAAKTDHFLLPLLLQGISGILKMVFQHHSSVCCIWF